MAVRDLVVLLPGIGGSILSKDERTLWGLSAGAILRALATGGGSIRELALDGDDPDLDDLGDGVSATGLIPDLHLIPGLWKIDGYGAVAKTLVKDLGLVRDKNFFMFPYDWRRHNKVAARRLARQTHDWLRAWRDEGNADAKLILIGHSMGGLVARYFVECMEGWKDTRLLLTFGTPFSGSLNALGFLANGFSKGIGPLRLDFSETLRSFTSVYELLPTFPCVDTGGEELARVAEIDDLPNVDPAKARDAAAFHHEIELAQAQNAEADGYPLLYPMIGLRQPTFTWAAFRDGAVELSHPRDGEDPGGDGTVPRLSARPIELKGKAVGMFLNEAHASLQNARAALDHAIGAITGVEAEEDGLRALMIDLSLDLDDVYQAMTPGLVRVKPKDPAPTIPIDIVDTETGQPVAPIQLLPAPDGWLEGRFTLPEGTYRLAAGDNLATRRVTDCFGVVAPEGGA